MLGNIAAIACELILTLIGIHSLLYCRFSTERILLCLCLLLLTSIFTVLGSGWQAGLIFVSKFFMISMACFAAYKRERQVIVILMVGVVLRYIELGLAGLWNTKYAPVPILLAVSYISLLIPTAYSKSVIVVAMVAEFVQCLWLEYRSGLILLALFMMSMMLSCKGARKWVTSAIMLLPLGYSVLLVASYYVLFDAGYFVPTQSNVERASMLAYVGMNFFDYIWYGPSIVEFSSEINSLTNAFGLNIYSDDSADPHSFFAMIWVSSGAVAMSMWFAVWCIMWFRLSKWNANDYRSRIIGGLLYECAGMVALMPPSTSTRIIVACALGISLKAAVNNLNNNHGMINQQ